MNRFIESNTSIPKLVILTDHSSKAEMIAAHFLEQANCVNDLWNARGYIGWYQKCKLFIQPTGFGEVTATNYLNELLINHSIKQVLFFGECISHTPTIQIRDIIVAKKAYRNNNFQLASDNLIFRSQIVSHKLSLPIKIENVHTNDRYFIEKQRLQSHLTDFSSYSLYEYANNNHVEIVSILIVSENSLTQTKMEASEIENKCFEAAQFSLTLLAHGWYER